MNRLRLVAIISALVTVAAPAYVPSWNQADEGVSPDNLRTQIRVHLSRTAS